MSTLPTIEIVEEREIDAALDAMLRDLLCGCFPEWADIFCRHRLWHNTPPIFSVLCRDEPDGEIIGHIAVVVRSITTTWNWRYNVASIQGVCVRPSRRHEKLGYQMLERALAEATRRGFLYAILFCKEPLVPYYTEKGWQLADDSMVMWNNRDLPIAMRSNCPMYKELTETPFPEGPLDVHSPSW